MICTVEFRLARPTAAAQISFLITIHFCSTIHFLLQFTFVLQDPGSLIGIHTSLGISGRMSTQNQPFGYIAVKNMGNLIIFQCTKDTAS